MLSDFVYFFNLLGKYNLWPQIYFYKVKKIMTGIIKIILIDALYLHREKDNIPNSVVHVA